MAAATAATKFVERPVSKTTVDVAKQVLEPMSFTCGGPSMPNRFMLAPLTNSQSGDDGIMSEEEFVWLTKRAVGGHGATMTCASHVQAIGQGFPGQLGCWSDDHIPGLTRLAAEIKKHNSVAIVQLHHAGMRTPKELIGGKQPVSPSEDEETQARALSTAEVKQLRDDFIQGAIRAQKAGFDGVELHGAHGYIICAFMSPEYNKRTDEYGPGSHDKFSPEARAGRMRLLREIITGIRKVTRKDFILGLRVSAERFGMEVPDIVEMTRIILAEEPIDFLDISAWDVRKKAEGQDGLLIDYFLKLPRNGVKVGLAGKIKNVQDVEHCIAHGADFVLPGRASILQHDFPKKITESILSGESYYQPQNPVPAEHLAQEFLSPKFIKYMSSWPGFVAPAAKL
mmetsp:Transcript_5133/g.12246  ORF Transcript_5133/g.12246 Transcript_5133/m.12246 type:complete len:397 (-) Transcript_5133:205-1395(-)|eukprot:CAMPEP_0206441434 /NCGR_PEP_ID=MMETSP0324_2-20121206/13278_1 /ASSEMBLY_ACC=CAM_ASM_000836 /TAXON_ID=2866 /ORGANISM="Crypthecodinium cohnii, Strain Seligo" /LENGTH=396 /DNA_ID=CAMNT_0053909193 /DNA_START=164 /DNA_END=1354 /DNA_ORIENTATION=+